MTRGGGKEKPEITSRVNQGTVNRVYGRKSQAKLYQSIISSHNISSNSIFMTVVYSLLFLCYWLERSFIVVTVMRVIWNKFLLNFIFSSA